MTFPKQPDVEIQYGLYMKTHIIPAVLLLILLVSGYGSLGKKTIIKKQTGWPADTRPVAIKDTPVTIRFLSASHAGN
jgi:hypothetical protein